MLRKLTIINKQCQFWRLANVIQHAFQHAFLRYDRPFGKVQEYTRLL